MKSLRAKISLITICIVTVVIIIFTGLSVFFIRNTEHRKSTKLLLLLAETGKSNLDYYFNSVQKGVVNVSNYASSNLNGIDDESLEEQVEKVRVYFDEVANKTNGVLTYYYRIDPEISSNVKGFWYIDLDGRGFVEHAPTDISLYDPNDQTQLVWFNVPKYQKKAIWLAPYITDNLNVRVISYNQPIFYRGEFIGVVGIEIDYSVMAKQIDNIKLFGNGYAFLSNEKGELFYHPYIDVATLTDESKLKAPKEFNTDDLQRLTAVL